MVTATSCLGWSQFYCNGWSQLFIPLDDYNCLLPWMIIAVYCLELLQFFGVWDDHSCLLLWIIITIYCLGWSQLFTALDDYNSLLPWMITAVYCLGWLQLFTALDDYSCLLPWMITAIYCIVWSQLFVAMDHHSFYCTGWQQLFIALDDHSCYCLGRLQLLSTLDDQSCLLITFLTLVNLQQLVHINTVSELTHTKISHLVWRKYVFLTGCWRDSLRAQIIPGPIKVSLQWRYLYAWMSHDHLAPQLTHETVTPYEEVRYQTHQHSSAGSQTCGLPVHLTQTYHSYSNYSTWPSSVQAIFFNLNCFLWWAVKLTKKIWYCWIVPYSIKSTKRELNNFNR